MKEGKPSLPWPGVDERVVIKEMLRDSNSKHWHECQEFVERYVQTRARNIPKDHRDDIIQNVMIRVAKYLPTFQYQCSLRTWLFNVARSCVIDTFRRLALPGRLITSLDDPYDDNDREDGIFIISTALTAEDECIIRCELEHASQALREYVITHTKSRRNWRILEMVIYEGYSLEDTARSVGCSTAIVGYVVREAQRYAREKLDHPY